MKFWELAILINGLLYVWLIAYHRKAGWIFGILSSFAQIYVSYKSKYYLDSGLNVFYVIIGFYGYIKWKEKETAFICYKLTKKEWVTYICWGVFLSVASGLLFSKLGNAHPFLDGFTTVFSIIATILTIQKKIENWWIWFVVDIVLIYMFYDKKLFINALMFFVYLIMAILGWNLWKKNVYENSDNRSRV